MIIKIENDKSLKALRKNLRNNMPFPEVLLWTKLKGSQTGYKFRRQHSIGKYILDFYCPAQKLCIEVDGDSHFSDKSIEYDKNRTSYLRSLDIIEIRFNNLEITSNINGVVERIIDTLKTTPNPSLKRRGNQEIYKR